jgi:hypothetical protein
VLVGTINPFFSEKYRVINCFDINLQIHRQNMVDGDSNCALIGYI